MTHLQSPDCGFLYTAEQTRQLDRLCMQKHHLDGFELMTRAARASYRFLRQRWPRAKTIAVFCGSGNNGGDGLIIAGMARHAGLQVRAFFPVGVSVDRLRGDARKAHDWAVARGVQIDNFSSSELIEADVLVDALLGTGIQQRVREAYGIVIDAMNASTAPVLAIDVPSGLCSDTGAVLGQAVHATATVCFIGIKRGLLTHCGPDYCGELRYARLDVPESIFEAVPSSVALIDESLLRCALKPRARGAHKGDFGHLLVIGGDHGMAGAALMAAQAAVRAGAGLVSLATQPEHVAACAVRCPEVMARGVRSGHELLALIERASAVLIGPGLGQGAWAKQLLQQVQTLDLPMVWDADALNQLSQGMLDRGRCDNWILTPHPGEAARLLGVDTKTLQADRFAAVRELQGRYGGVTLLKGVGSLVCDGTQTLLCGQGNPGMASGGMGDVLAGVTGALTAQGLIPLAAAAVAARVHAQAADLEAAANGERGLCATDLLPRLRRLLNPELSALRGMGVEEYE